MKISVITPSFNQAQFLPVNLKSVKAQAGVDVEHIIVDPGSTDGSTQIARMFPGVILVAEPDRGQSDGICKGFARSTGDILVWLNSDDFYPDDRVLSSVLQCFEENPDVDIVYGNVNFVNERGEFLREGFINKDSDILLESFQYQVGIVQPGVFWRRRVFEEIGGPSEEFEYCMDYELWVRMASKGYKWKYLPKILAHHRWWGGMKTSSRRDLSLREHCKVCDRYFGYVHWKWLDRFADYLCSRQDGVVHHAASINEVEKAKTIRMVIDEVVSQEMLRKLSLANDPELVATRQYIHYHYPDKCRVYFGQSELDIVSEVADDPQALQRIAWNIFDATTPDGKVFKSYHVPGNFDRYFEQGWHKLQLDRAKSGLRRLSMERRGDTCIIVGNGPSLRKSDLSLLANVDTIISNFAGLSPELRRFARILTVVNDLVAKQGAIDFNASQLIKVVPFWLGNYFNECENTFFVNATVRPEFGVDFVNAASWRSTVSFFNMQLAYALGYRKVILIGFDHSYVQPKDVVEGSVISQVEDDENHFDPRYFKGKDWQAADTINMEKMYVIAKTAFEKDGREIVNCTVGGKLELFRRSRLEAELCIEVPAPTGQAQAFGPPSFPKLLMIDSTPIGQKSATGQIKLTFLGDWPKSSFLQIWETGGPQTTLHAIELGQHIEDSLARPLSISAVIDKCRSFQPDVIYFRPVDSESLFEIAELITLTISKPLVIHMMDDWPERLRLTDYAKFSNLDFSLRRLLGRASCRLSICDAMSNVYNVRYGGSWQSLANGVDLTDYPVRDWSKLPDLSSPTAPAVIRYMGALADDMTYAGVKDIASVVSALQNEVPVRFEIYTMDWCLPKAHQELGTLPGVVVAPLVEYSGYRRLLREADILVIAYNFDAESINYIGLSLANKMPECLASGAALLAYGPGEVATIDFLNKAGCAQVLDQRDIAALRETVKQLVTRPAMRKELSDRARAFAAGMLSKQSVQDQFMEYVSSAEKIFTDNHPPVVGPFERDISAQYDETDCIAHMFMGSGPGKVMIDVGAHNGGSLTPFLDMGWNIHAFEPDDVNRVRLLDRLLTHRNRELVSVDPRCVTNKSQKGVPFYRSAQSTGISGLSAFHESHVDAQRIDTVTLSEYFMGRPLTSVDFLKIDTEGHDLFVLQGFPWERCKPAVIECEFEDVKTVPLAYTFHDIARFLLDKGYTVYVSEWHPILRYGIQHDWHRLTRYPCELADPEGWGNLLAFREPIDEKLLVAAVNDTLKIDIDRALKAKNASRLLREKKYLRALWSYLELHGERALKAHADNALTCAHELGMTDIRTFEQLSQSVETNRDSILRASAGRINKFENIHAGRRCVIIGNGPSLNNMDLSFLEHEITFGMNRIYLLFERWKFHPTYYASVNPLVLEQSADQILKIAAPKFLSDKGIPFFLNPPEDVMFINSLPDWRFSYDPHDGLCQGYTVTFVAMQLAYFMGFSEVVLIGVDHHFVTQGEPNKVVTSDGTDPNHFHPDYFGKGVRWQLPDLEGSEVSYMLAKLAFEKDGRRILDATVDGKLSIFPKVDYRKYFATPYNPSKPYTVEQFDSKALLKQSNILIGMGRIEEAFSFLEMASKQLPCDASLPFALGLIRECFQDSNGSVEYFEAAVRLEPSNVTYLLKLAACYHESCGRSEEALNLLNMVLRADEKKVEAYRLISDICMSNGQVNDALYFKEIATRLSRK